MNINNNININGSGRVLIMRHVLAKCSIQAELAAGGIFLFHYHRVLEAAIHLPEGAESYSCVFLFKKNCQRHWQLKTLLCM